mgnify:CR=1 FL=1
MKKVKSIFKKALAMMGENEVKAWGIAVSYTHLTLPTNREV